jgi:O-methyltransferase
MVGWRRLDNIEELIQKVARRGVLGDFVETGSWRGGAAIYARYMLNHYAPNQNRTVFVCDSFQGLPPPRELNIRGDDVYVKFRALAVSLDQVKSHFETFGLTKGVRFVKVRFNLFLQ